MRRSFQVLIVASSLTAFFWVGCGDDGDTNSSDNSSSSSLGSTGTASSSTASSVVSTGSSTSSSTGGGAMSACNPVNNEPCNTAGGAACDINGNDNVFVCYGPPNDNDVCQECGSDTLGWCKPSYTCIPGENNNAYCAKYCCDDNDCGAAGRCEKIFDQFDLSEVGVCMLDPNAGTGGAGGAGTGGAGGAGTGGAGTGGAGTGGAGTGGAPPVNPAAATHDCSPPDPSPSNGSCVTLP